MGSAEHLKFLVAGVLSLANGCGGESVTKSSAVGDGPNAGDGGASTADLAPKSGTRLRVLPYSPSYSPVRDSERSVDCTPRLAADGVERCLPYYPRPVYFSDSSCTHPIVVRGQNPPAYCKRDDEYFTDDGGASRCAAPKLAVYTAGAAIDPPAQLYGHGVEFCMPAAPEAAMGSVLEFYDAIPSAPTKWVELDEHVVPVTDSLAVVNWSGSDGSRIRNGFRLLPSGIACDRYPDPNEVLLTEPPSESWCVPSVRARADLMYPEYADDQCSGERLAASCAPAEVVEGEGSPLPPLYEAGTPVSPVYFQNMLEGGACMLLPPHDPSSPDPSLFYAHGPRLAANRYPSLTLGKNETGRVQTVFLQSDGKNLVPDSFYDTKYDQACTPMPLSDGGVWCVPGALWVDDLGSVVNAFADPACTRRVLVSSSQPDDPLAPFHFALLFPNDRFCKPTEYAVLHSIHEYSGPTFQAVGSECSPFVAQSPSPLMFQLGEELDPATVLEGAP
jgi:hypothetical protein